LAIPALAHGIAGCLLNAEHQWIAQFVDAGRENPLLIALLRQALPCFTAHAFQAPEYTIQLKTFHTKIST
jgi:hypothetical protein